MVKTRELLVCPKCERPQLEFSGGRYHCLWRDCLWTQTEQCKYPPCSDYSAYPDDYCTVHRELIDFLYWYGSG